MLRYFNRKIKFQNLYADHPTNSTFPKSEVKEIIDLEWVDGFIKEIKPYIYVRELDNLLILIPNQVYKLNQSGVAILNYLLKGNSIKNLIELTGDDDEKRKDLYYFFCDLRAIVRGCLKEGEKRECILL